MKLKKIILTGLTLSGSLFANTLSETTSLIERIKTVNPSERFELMNQIKSNILSLNQNDQTTAIQKMRESRKNARDAKLATYRATLTPEQLVVFEEKLKLKKEARRERKAKLKQFRDSLSDEQRQEFANLKKNRKSFYKGSGRKTRYGKHNKVGKKITTKVQTTLTPEQMERFKHKIENKRR